MSQENEALLKNHSYRVKKYDAFIYTFEGNSWLSQREYDISVFTY